ncbi:MAG: DNA helicase RecQ [Candidatus Marinimicrobia bacterium]|nr:DNA helicase RecQ [Candidatus Neomarinimicrobiota bacterium]
MIKAAQKTLKNIFGYDEFRPLQQEVIENVLNRKDTLCIMPTGGGKSLCYQIPALLFEGLTIVVSPLISLMEDQVKQLEALGVDALMLNSSLSPQEYQDNTRRIRQKEIRLLYLAPETLLMERTLTLLASQKVACFTIDEAHCISEWGHDFRPEYRQLMDLRATFPEAVCLALTATATQRVQQDIRRSLHFETSASFVASFNRENLFLEIRQKSQPAHQTLQFLEKFPNQSGIIYCLSRKQVDEMSEFLEDEGYSVKPYHAGLPTEIRQQNQASFIRDDTQIMVATIAFGMGINKPNVRFILHFDLPSNIESYYQQIGRAGRDGLRADCLFLFGYGDIRKIKFFIGQKKPSEQVIASTQLNALIGLAETEDCRRIPLLKYFGEEAQTTNCGMCDNCLNEKQTVMDVTIPAQQFLSCVKHSKEIFGAGHIIDILRGSKSQKIKKFTHHKLSTYGIGKELSKQQWFYLSRQFIQKELLIQDMQHGSLKLTAQAWEVLRGNLSVSAKMETQRKARLQPKTELKYDLNLFEVLRQLRKTMADNNNVPPYVIFPDKTLIEMAIYFPHSEEVMLQLHGVGTVKYEKYADPFMRAITDYCQINELTEIPKHGTGRKSKSISKRIGKLRHQVVGEKYNAGTSFVQLTKEFNVKNNTILDHLFKYSTEGNNLRFSDDFLETSQLTPQQQTAVSNAFKQYGTSALRPVFDALNEEVSFEGLKIMRLHYLSERQQKEQ